MYDGDDDDYFKLIAVLLRHHSTTATTTTMDDAVVQEIVAWSLWPDRPLPKTNKNQHIMMMFRRIHLKMVESLRRTSMPLALLLSIHMMGSVLRFLIKLGTVGGPAGNRRSA